MDPNLLLKALEGAFSSDATCRTEAEEYLRSLQKTFSTLENFLNCASNLTIDNEIRKCAVVHLKNEIKYHWSHYADSSIEQKQQLLFLIYQTLVKAFKHEDTTRSHFMQCFHELVQHVSLQEGSLVINALRQDIEQEADLDPMLASLKCQIACIRTRTSDFEGEEAAQFGYTIKTLLASNLKTLIRLCPLGISHDKAFLIIKNIIKFYGEVVQSTLFESVIVESLNSWLEVIVEIIRVPVPTELNNKNVDMLDSLSVFKAKCQCLRVMMAFFSQYGKKKTFIEETSASYKQQIQNHIHVHWAKSFFSLLAKILDEENKQKALVSINMKCLMLECVMTSVEVASLYQHSKDMIEFFIFEVCYLILPENKDERLELETTPEDAISSQSFLSKPNARLRNTAQTFIATVARLRSKKHLEAIYGFAQMMLNESKKQAEQPNLTPQMLHEINSAKISSFYIIGSISRRLVSFKRSVPIESFLYTYVYPELTNQDVLLRIRACWVYKEFFNKIEKWKDVPALIQTCQGIIHCLSDSLLPVQLEALAAIESLLESTVHPQLNESLIQNLPNLLTRIHSLMSAYVNESVVVTFKCVITYFKEHLKSYAMDLMIAVTQVLIKVLTHGVPEEFSDSYMVIIYLIESIKSILESVQDDPEQFYQISLVIISHMEKFLEPDCTCYFDDAMNLLSYITYYSSQCSVYVWKLFEVLYKQLMSSEADEDLTDLEAVAPALSNTIVKDPQTFIEGKGENGKAYKVMLVEFLDKLYLEEADMKKTLGLLMTVLQVCCKYQAADDILYISFQNFWSALTSQTVSFFSNRYGSRVISIYFFYNAQKIFQILEELGITVAVLQFWTTQWEIHKTYDDTKASVMALARILQLLATQPTSVPQIFREAPAILVSTFQKQVSLVKSLKTKAEQAPSDADSEYVDSEEDLQEDEDAQDLFEFSKYSDKFKAAFASKLYEFDGEDDDDDDESYDCDEDSSIYWVDSLEAYDEIEVIKGVFEEQNLTLMESNFINWVGKDGYITLVDTVKDAVLPTVHESQ